MAVGLQGEDMKLIPEWRAKLHHFVTVFSSQEGKLEKKWPGFFQVAIRSFLTIRC